MFPIDTVSIFLVLIVRIETQRVFHVGSIFDTEDINKELSFLVGIDRLNERTEPIYRLEPVISTIKSEEPFKALVSSCSLLNTGITALFGPSSRKNTEATQSLCDNKEIPLIETSWNFQDERKLFLLNLYPSPSVLAKMYVDIVTSWGWKGFTILYENHASFAKIKELLSMYNSSGHTVVVRQLDKSNSGNYRPTLKEALKSLETHFLLDCALENLDEILRQAQQVGLIAEKYHFIITNFDTQTIDLNPYQHGDANITTLNLVDLDDPLVSDVVGGIQTLRARRDLVGDWSMQIDTALMIDAIELFGRALKEATTMPNFAEQSLNCTSDDNWEFGYSLVNFMKMDHIKGLTGSIKFDHEGKRSDFEVSIKELTDQGSIDVGSWNSTEGLKIDRKIEETEPIDGGSLKNRTFRVITALTAPYAMLRKSPVKLTGNDQYEGFGVDLIAELSLMEGFNYVFQLRHDKANGRYDPDLGRWTGMIGDVMNGDADLAITDLTITAVREEAVDFTAPFMSLGISILYRKAEKAPPSFFSFAAPFANDVWLVLAGAAFGVSISLFITGRLSPAEWDNPYPCIEEPKYLLNQFSLKNSFWFMMGSLMQQGSEIAPIAIATRMIAGLWWFFALIMVSSYTANLASFLTTDSPEIHFNNIKELVEKADKYQIKYGAKTGGATADFFKEGAKNSTIYKDVWDHMQSHPKEMVSDNTDGVEMAELGRYAFFMESTSIEYEIQRHCNLTQVGGKLDEKSYGIAMKKNSTFRRTLSTALLKLASQGTIDKLKRRWWEEKGEHCSNEEAAEGAPPLGFKNVSGIFWVTIGGSILAMLFVLIEMIVHTFRVAVLEKISFREELKKEIEFFFKFKENAKPIERRKSIAPSTKSEENGIEQQ